MPIMAQDTHLTSNAAWPNWLTLVLAVWLFISPWVLPSVASGWSWDAWIVAILIGALSIAALAQMTEWEDWGNLILGAWLFISPWLLGFGGSGSWNAWIVGALVAIISIWGIVAIRTVHHQQHSAHA
jgi:hypothetical protein